MGQRRLLGVGEFHQYCSDYSTFQFSLFFSCTVGLSNVRCVLSHVQAELLVYCYLYSPTFNENSDMQVNVSWPSYGFTEPQVRTKCQSIIVNSTYIGDTCFDNNSGGSTSSNDIVQACINDVQVFPVFLHNSLLVILSGLGSQVSVNVGGGNH